MSAALHLPFFYVLDQRSPFIIPTCVGVIISKQWPGNLTIYIFYTINNLALTILQASKKGFK
ncbi:MAG: hypothetical protein A3D44_04170 [Candidatus Staskawiczbacteria bacterium RIFCSPHIGHO2_02_FULL_42_22]|uniref:Uncharacterized protein n=1 Tax=Candidatus Staskawiczbacteria bacterium RIFCSPHIGHO2_02_FULL_42_22 TaxID=1802207 RepID=A0A1G2I4K0_9BACT|nr:MAG: hypothetical protein A3D44_04170 [Candidatus Staskawiczbacteria bacterium RIFCSPHIGHO2_02_FULL_42_22]